jgi:CrcB protein
MMRTLLVALGGMLGCVARYWLTGAVQHLSSSDFPYGTLAVNLLGSFLIGIVVTCWLERGVLSAEAAVLLATGFCGGFTTMSTFSFESLALLDSGRAALALGNLAGTFAGCVTATWLGRELARAF